MTRYEIKEGQMFRDGAVIAVVNGEDLDWVGNGKRYAGPAFKHLFSVIRGASLHDIPQQTGMDATDAEYFNGSLKSRYPDYRGPIEANRGDLTPQFVVWLHRFFPAEASVRYEGRYNMIPLQALYAIQ